MILSSQTLRSIPFIVQPFCARTLHESGTTYGLGPCGIDIRIAQDVFIPKGGFELASSLEQFNMPANIMGRVADKSTWARKGLAVQNTIIEPGWRGYLTLELTAHRDALNFVAGTPIAQIVFEFLDQVTDQPYVGKYQDQAEGAVDAIFERVSNADQSGIGLGGVPVGSIGSPFKDLSK